MTAVRVRAIAVVRPRGDTLTYDDIAHQRINRGAPVVVELGRRSYDQTAAVALASLAASGHPVDIRGAGGWVTELAADVERQALQLVASEPADPLPWEALTDDEKRAARARQEPTV